MTLLNIETIDNQVTIWMNGRYHHKVMDNPTAGRILLAVWWLWITEKINIHSLTAHLHPWRGFGGQGRA